jgi:uncharacterized protein YjiS (DUF1127 family)
VAQRNVDDLLSTVNQNETKSHLTTLNSQLQNLNNQLSNERNRSLELEKLTEQLKADIALGMKESHEREKTHAEGVDRFQLQVTELQQQLQQQLEIVQLQQEEIKLLKEQKSLPAPVVETTESGVGVGVAGPPVDLLQQKQQQQSQPPAPAEPAAVSPGTEEELLKLQQKLEALGLELQTAIATEESCNQLKTATKNDIKKWMKEFEKANGPSSSSSPPSAPPSLTTAMLRTSSE